MRAALGLGLALLVTVVLLNAGGALGRRARLGHAGADEAVFVLVAARGHLLPPASWGRGQGTLSDTIMVGDATLVQREPSSGLRLAVLGARRELVDYRNFDVAGDQTAAADLARRCAEVPRGGVVVLASRGRIRPRGASAERSLGTLRDLAGRLGSELDPFATRDASWALIAQRGGHGWNKLAEAWSEESGVLLSFVLDADGQRYHGYDGETLRLPLEQPALLALVEELDGTAASSGTPEYSVRYTVGGQPKRAIHTSPSGRVVWEDLFLGAEPVFQAFVGLADRSPAPEGARFALLVDGRVLHEERVVATRDARHWSPWLVDLAGFAGRRVSLELRVESEGAPPGTAPLWGEPVIRYAPRP